VEGVSSQFSMMMFSYVRLLAGFALFKAFVSWTHGAYGTHHFGVRQCGDGGRAGRGGYRRIAACRHGIEFTAASGGFFSIGGADGAHVISGLQAAHPGELVDVVQFLARYPGHEDVQRLRLVYPFGATRGTLDDPAGINLE